MWIETLSPNWLNLSRGRGGSGNVKKEYELWEIPYAGILLPYHETVEMLPGPKLEVQKNNFMGDETRENTAKPFSRNSIDITL